ncbi:hypothetical protein [Reichenbachiella versicolor]|uniref:hypothetical protein n=1 Tax=Reichenbachiella versicolor TaxID=1821036 RepID=UPI000D6E514F|nr:hypothetical protein [Reichenbachiella versicolor]
MRNSNGSNVCLNGKNVESVNDSEIFKSVNSVEQEFIGNLKFHGIEELIESLKMVHDFALYHTDLCFDTPEKIALFNLKFLWGGGGAVGKILTLQNPYRKTI